MGSNISSGPLKIEGSAVQVVQVEDGSYRLDEEALQSILLRPELVDLPVVVVSVAGPYRGGKSFLLNFFLRYINSPRLSQLDKSWIGEEGGPLEGFSWRGGSTRNTTGIVMWSEPVVTTLHSGERVAVLLMDTQGTSDRYSTMKNCSSIFALSTLLSSVQVYNLSHVIREEDLEYLQIFTEYGNLLKEKDFKAFQNLEFLVRDWQYADTDHPYGSKGGNAYLEKTLKMNYDLQMELRQLRDQLRSSSQQLSCFLMPHPGLVVQQLNFKGQTKGTSKLIFKQFQNKEKLMSISEHSDNFSRKLSYLPNLYKMASRLFHHLYKPGKLAVDSRIYKLTIKSALSKMKPKEVGGQLVTASSLFTYFKAYMKVFNAEKLPSAMSILQATEEGYILSAFEEARRLYESSMEADCGPSQLSIPADDLKDVHDTHSTRAIASFNSKKKMASESDCEEYLEKLEKEFKDHLIQFVELNINKTQVTLHEAREIYETKTAQMKSKPDLCVHPLDLREVHLEGLQAATDFYDRNRRNISGKEDKDRADLVKGFEKEYKLLKQINDQNNKMNVTELHLQYWQTMEEKCSGETPSPSELQKIHKRTLFIAVESFESRRNYPYGQDTDEFESNLIKMIEDCYAQMSESNNNKIKAALEAGIKAYDRHMANAWDPKKVCLHPGDLVEEKNNAELKAMTEFRPSKVSSGNVHFDTTDDDEKTLAEVLEARFKEIKKVNDSANQAAVKAALEMYRSEMIRNNTHWIYGIYSHQYVVNNWGKYYHNESLAKAFDFFQGKRRPTRCCGPDQFASDLYEKIKEARKKY